MSDPFIPFIFELCAETHHAAGAARAGGAHRIELCTDLAVGGLTPPPSLVEAAVASSGLPVHVLLRPTAATFCYSPEVFAAIAQAMGEARRAGAAGFVLGLLGDDRRVDREHTRALVELAGDLPVTFHRAFDTTPDLDEALEDVIATGCARLLTSGGADDVLAGASALARLVARAGTRIEIAVGGGLTLENAAGIVHRTGSHHFHASLRSTGVGAGNLASPGTLEARIAAMIAILSEASQPAGSTSRAEVC